MCYYWIAAAAAATVYRHNMGLEHDDANAGHSTAWSYGIG
jgi:hypothetical protein